jgi:hypothetical protein
LNAHEELLEKISNAVKDSGRAKPKLRSIATELDSFRAEVVETEPAAEETT